MLLVLVLRILVAAAVLYLRENVNRAVWIIRSSLIVDISVSSMQNLLLSIAHESLQLFIHAFSAIRIPRPVALRLVRPTQLSSTSNSSRPASSASSPYPYIPPDNLLSDLTLNQVQPKHHPVFGETSLSPRPPYSQFSNDDMDWEPTPPSALYNGGYTFEQAIPTYIEQDGSGQKGEWDNFAVGKQRMFGRKEGEDETGLEGLLAGWGLAEPVQSKGGGPGQGWTKSAMSWFSGGKLKGR